MARIGISITKSCAFRNGTQEFSNVYYYNNGAGVLPDQTEMAARIDALVTLEKTWHTSNVTFVRGRGWSAGLGASGNEMIDQHNLSGSGAVTLQSNIDKERAFLFRLRAGNDSRGNPVYLRKWYHCWGIFPGLGANIGQTVIENSTGFNSTQRNNMASTVDAIRTQGALGVWKLCSKSGRDFGAGQVFGAHEFYEHHQFGDQWRAQ